ncbi:uncharacterized protein LOC135367611 [Ornithodoros turicata]
MFPTGIVFLTSCLCLSMSSAEDVRMSVMMLSEQVRDLQQRQERSSLEMGRDFAELAEDIARIKEVNDDRTGFFNKLVTEFSERKDNLRMKLKEASSSVSKIIRTLQRRQRRRVPQEHGDSDARRRNYDIEPYFSRVTDKIADLAVDVQGLLHDLKRKSVVNENCFKRSRTANAMSRLVTAWCPPVFRDTGKRTCAELLKGGHREDGVYATRLGDKTVPTFCDMSTDGGGWNVLLRSHSPTITSSENASGVNHLWNPIGDLSLDFWWGWKNVLLLTHSQLVELNVTFIRPLHANHTDEEYPATRQAVTIERDGNSYILTSVFEDDVVVNKTARVMKLTGENVQVYNEDGRKIAECPAAVEMRVYLAEEVVNLDLKCLGVFFTGREIGYYGIVVRVRPILPAACVSCSSGNEDIASEVITNPWSEYHRHGENMASWSLSSLLVTTFAVFAAAQNRLYSRIDEVEGIIKDVRDQIQADSNLRMTQGVHLQLTVDKLQKQVEEMSGKVNSMSKSGGASIPSDVNARLRSLESTLNSLQGDVGVKVDTSLEKLHQVESQTARMKDEMDSKLRKVMNGINTIYDMNKEMKSSMSGGSSDSSPRREQEVIPSGQDTSINFLIDTIEDTQRTVQEKIDVLKNQLGRKLESLEVLTSSLMQQNEALITELDRMKSCASRDVQQQAPTPASYARGSRNSWNDSADVTNRVLLELKVSQLEMKNDFTKMMKEVEGSLESIKQCSSVERGERGQRRVADERDLDAAASVGQPRKVHEVEEPTQSAQSGKCVTASHMMNPKNCADLSEGGATCDGVYIVYTHGIRALRVYCDMATDGGGWTVIMRRGNYTNLPLSFNHDWNGYKHGFGDLESEFWLGNDNIHMLTKENPMEVRVTLESFDGETVSFDYDDFLVGSESENYRLRVGNYAGTNSRVGNSFRRHSNQVFSTPDRSPVRNNNCAASHRAGWWFHSCMSVLLTGDYASERNSPSNRGIRWPSWKTVPLKYVEVKMRPKAFGRQ